MTKFIYENQRKVQEISKRCIGEESLKRIRDAKDLKVYQYIACYWVWCGNSITPRIIKILKKEMLRFDKTKEMMIFLEKLENTPKDRLYFEALMASIEENYQFLHSWNTKFKKVA